MDITWLNCWLKGTQFIVSYQLNRGALLTCLCSVEYVPIVPCFLLVDIWVALQPVLGRALQDNRHVTCCQSCIECNRRCNLEDNLAETNPEKHEYIYISFMNKFQTTPA